MEKITKVTKKIQNNELTYLTIYTKKIECYLLPNKDTNINDFYKTFHDKIHTINKNIIEEEE